MTLPVWKARDAIVVIDGLLAGLYGVTKAGSPPNPLTPKGFDAVVFGVLQDIKKTTEATQQAGLADTVQLLERSWTGMTPAERTAAIDKAAATYLTIGRDVAPLVGDVLKDQGPAISVATKLAATKMYPLRIQPSFDMADKTAIEFAATSQGNYIRDEYGKRSAKFSHTARDIVSQGMEEGLDRYDISKRLGDALNTTEIARAQSYWMVIASVFTARARAFSVLRSFDDAGIDAFQVQAVLDEVTTEICRFMNGRVFQTSGALAKFNEAEDASDPEMIKDIQPWASVGKADDGGQALYFKQGGQKHLIASIDKPAVGQKDEVGTYSNTMSSKGLQQSGLCSPPFHGHCRSTLLPVFGAARVSVPEPPPEQPVRPPPRLPIPAKVELAIPHHAPAELPANIADLVRPLPLGDYESSGDISDKLKALQQTLTNINEAPSPWAWDTTKKFVEVPMQPIPVSPDTGAVQLPFTKPHHLVAANAKKKGLFSDVPINAIVAPTSTPTGAAKETLGAMLKGLEPAPDPKSLVFYKSGGKFYTLPGDIGPTSNAVGLAHYSGNPSIKATVVDMDTQMAKPKKVPKPKKEAPAPQPLPPPVKISAPPQVGNADVILHKKVGEQRGSNDGGFYEGSDGVQRYVKFYADPSQAHCENLANAIYKDLGFASPESQVFENKGKTAYASKIFEGGKTLREVGLSKEHSQKFAQGFTADVLTGNWDAMGTGHDNAMLLPDGRIARIDNGGTFLFRAKEGRKATHLLGQITETEVFFTQQNPYYSGALKQAGFTRVEDMSAALTEGVAQIKKLRDSAGGWQAYVDKVAGGMKATDKSAVVQMLNTRTDLLDKKVADLNRPKPPPPKPGEARFTAQQSSDVRPKKGLKLEHLPETKVDAWMRDTSGSGNKMPSGESRTEYTSRTKAELNKLDGAQRNAIVGFTGSEYTSVRESEESGHPNTKSQRITEAFGIVAPEPGTVFRGIQIQSYKISGADTRKAVIDQFLENSESWGMGKNGKGATSSTSWDARVAIKDFMGGESDAQPSEYKVLFKINGKSQIAIDAISSFEREKELLVSSKARFRTTGLSRLAGTKNVLIVECEEI